MVLIIYYFINNFKRKFLTHFQASLSPVMAFLISLLSGSTGFQQNMSIPALQERNVVPAIPIPTVIINNANLSRLKQTPIA